MENTSLKDDVFNFLFAILKNNIKKKTKLREIGIFINQNFDHTQRPERVKVKG